MGNQRTDGHARKPSTAANADTLFRRQVGEALSAQYLGSVRGARLPSFTAVTVAALALAAALAAFAVWGEVTRKARLPGILSPVLGSLQVTAQQAGTVIERRVVEGQLVGAGDPLFVIGIDRATLGAQAQGQVAGSFSQRRLALDSERGLREQLALQRRASIAERIESVQLELVRASAESDLARRRVTLARRSAERFADLAREGFVADIQRQEKQDEALDVEGRAKALDRGRIALQRELQTLRSELAAVDTQLQTDLAVIDRGAALLSQETTESDARRELVIVAPAAGVVSGMAIHRGQAVQAGQTLATLVPNDAAGKPSPLEAQLYAPSRTAGFVQAGQRVWLRYAAYPYQKFGMHGGSISEVSGTPINPQDLPSSQQHALQAATQGNEPLYRVTVTLDADAVIAYGKSHALKPGMALDADVVQDRRAIWEWVLEPVLAARQRAKVLGAASGAAAGSG